MAGNSNSGRHKIYEEYHKVSAINKLWEKVDNKISSGEELTEFEEKLVSSLLPRTIKTEQDITSGDKPLPLLAYVSNNIGHSEDNGDDQEDKDNTGGN
ncbi:MAG: hypothetical protein WCN88_04750 [Candidatus Falkowbacteria bacterium]